MAQETRIRLKVIGRFWRWVYPIKSGGFLGIYQIWWVIWGMYPGAWILVRFVRMFLIAMIDVVTAVESTALTSELTLARRWRPAEMRCLARQLDGCFLCDGWCCFLVAVFRRDSFNTAAPVTCSFTHSAGVLLRRVMFTFHFFLQRILHPCVCQSLTWDNCSMASINGKCI